MEQHGSESVSTYTENTKQKVCVFLLQANGRCVWFCIESTWVISGLGELNRKIAIKYYNTTFSEIPAPHPPALHSTKIRDGDDDDICGV